MLTCYIDEKECIITSPLRVSPFHDTGASTPPIYAFRGVCEHIFAKSCNVGQQFSIVGDFISEDLNTGRIGLEANGNNYIITEDLTILTDNVALPPTFDDNNEITMYAGGVQITTTR